MSFEDFNLHPRLRAALDQSGLHQPTPVQQAFIPEAMAGRDVMASARTGSGKTLAFLLPTLHRLLNLDPSAIQDSGTLALVLVPTRELARQTVRHCEQLTGSTPLRVAALTGGEDFKRQAALLRKNPEILVATPGRLLEHLERGTPDFDALQVLIIDEADRMLDMGFGDDVLLIAAQCNPARQTCLLSATLERKGLGGMCEQLLRDPAMVSLDGRGEAHGDIRQQILLADDRAHKERILLWLLANEAWTKCLVFCNTRAEADRLGQVLQQQAVPSAVLHGEMYQDERNRVMNDFRQGGSRVLLSTDLAARGLDIDAVDLVINVDIARSGDEHVHRVGRTGRAGQPGLAISLVSPSEWNLMAGIQRYLKQQFEQRHIAEVAGNYRGPKKLKSSGKAAGKKKKKNSTTKAAAKPKQRQRDRKNKGKRRKPGSGNVDGLGTLKKKT